MIIDACDTLLKSKHGSPEAAEALRLILETQAALIANGACYKSPCSECGGERYRTLKGWRCPTCRR